MNSIHDKEIYNLLVNDDFINYILNPNLILKEMWDEFFYYNPELIPFANKAKDILLGEDTTYQLERDQLEGIESRIFEKCGLFIV